MDSNSHNPHDIWEKVSMIMSKAQGNEENGNGYALRTRLLWLCTFILKFFIFFFKF